jgi:hypothetical protein
LDRGNLQSGSGGRGALARIGRYKQIGMHCKRATDVDGIHPSQCVAFEGGDRVRGHDRGQVTNSCVFNVGEQ